MADQDRNGDQDAGPVITAPWRVEVWLRFEHDPAMHTGTQVLLFDVTPHPQEVPIGEALAMGRAVADQMQAAVLQHQQDRRSQMFKGFGDPQAG
jgi:hypothetical protein